MSTTNKIKNLAVHTPQGVSGILSKESLYSFNYSARQRDCEISMTMPLRAQSYTQATLPYIFDMNLPEGYLKEKLVNALTKMGPVNDMRLLLSIGENSIGRLSFSEPGKDRKAVKREIALADLISSPSAELFDHLIDLYLESGISGVQPKVLMPVVAPLDKFTIVQPELIVKSSGKDYSYLTQNEYLCMTVAKNSGICTPDFWLSNDGGLFILKRFDRPANGVKLGFEDMTVIMNKSSQQKYEGSYENIAKAIKAFCAENASESLSRLFEYVAVSVMLRNGDAHLKNFGLLYEHPVNLQSVRLAPLYDVVTTTIYGLSISQYVVDRTLALKLERDRRYPSREALIRFGKNACLLNNPEKTIEKIANSMADVIKTVGDVMPNNMAALLKNEWQSGLITYAS